MKPIFILGMGAQKAATSWFHRLMNRNKNVNMGFRKEYHVWDAVFSDLAKNFKVPLKKPDNADSAMRRMMQTDPGIYIKYFQSLISSDVQVTGDITPSYSIIDKTNLEKIAKYLDDGGFEVKVVFFMRDPVERIWSTARHEEKLKKIKGDQLYKNFAEVRVQQYLKIPGHVARSDYKSTVQNIESVFHNNNIHFGIYENLFNETSIKKLSSFLGFSLSEVDLGEKVNASPERAITEETSKELEKFMKPQYEFCKERFPITKKIWRDIV